MSEFVVTTFDWVPELPRGFVRDLRVRWALEEAEAAYRVESVPFHDRDSEQFRRHPFGQVPWLTDGGHTIFESGAILLHIAERTGKLMPADPQGRSEVIQWLFAALNSVEAASLPWSLFMFSDDHEQTPGRKLLDGFLEARLQRMEAVLSDREWLAGDFSIADIMMADVLRLIERFDGMPDCTACRDYMLRATARDGFQKALADQLAHFAAADKET